MLITFSPLNPDYFTGLLVLIINLGHMKNRVEGSNIYLIWILRRREAYVWSSIAPRAECHNQGSGQGHLIKVDRGTSSKSCLLNLCENLSHTYKRVKALIIHLGILGFCSHRADSETKGWYLNLGRKLKKKCFPPDLAYEKKWVACPLFNQSECSKWFMNCLSLFTYLASFTFKTLPSGVIKVLGGFSLFPCSLLKNNKKMGCCFFLIHFVLLFLPQGSKDSSRKMTKPSILRHTKNPICFNVLKECWCNGVF